jgi:hypothetical protein
MWVTQKLCFSDSWEESSAPPQKSWIFPCLRLLYQSQNPNSIKNLGLIPLADHDLNIDGNRLSLTDFAVKNKKDTMQ